MAKILIIDDEESILHILRHWFEEEGHEVMTTFSADEGIGLFSRESPQLVIVDLIMPEKDGLETIRELKKRDPDLNIFAISGGGMIEPATYLSLAAKFGAIYTFEKPMVKTDFMSMAAHVLGSPAPFRVQDPPPA